MLVQAPRVFFPTSFPLTIWLIQFSHVSPSLFTLLTRLPSLLQTTVMASSGLLGLQVSLLQALRHPEAEILDKCESHLALILQAAQ